jgi:hypothetical protein
MADPRDRQLRGHRSESESNMPTDDPSKLAADPPAPATADSSALARGATVATLIAAAIAVLFMGLSLGYKVVHRADAQHHGPAANADAASLNRDMHLDGDLGVSPIGSGSREPRPAGCGHSFHCSRSAGSFLHAPLFPCRNLESDLEFQGRRPNGAGRQRMHRDAACR